MCRTLPRVPTESEELLPTKSTNACGHVCKYVDRKGIQSAGVTPEVNLRITQARKHTKGIHPGFETQGRHHQKSKRVTSVVLQKGRCPLKTFKKQLTTKF